MAAFVYLEKLGWLNLDEIVRVEEVPGALLVFCTAIAGTLETSDTSVLRIEDAESVRRLRAALKKHAV